MKITVTAKEKKFDFNMGDCIMTECMYSGAKQYYLVSKPNGWLKKGLFDLGYNVFYFLERKSIEELLCDFEEDIIDVIPACKLILKSK